MFLMEENLKLSQQIYSTGHIIQSGKKKTIFIPNSRKPRLTRSNILAIILNIMEKDFLSRQYLESMSTVDLITLADDYGIDIPDNLNRRFIIGELLETAEELKNKQSDNNDVQTTDEDSPVPDFLPESYNTTEICAILRNPVWAYVYWDVKALQKKKLVSDPDFKSLFLHVSFFDRPLSKKQDDTFDIDIKETTGEQYILVSSKKRFMQVELVCLFDGRSPEILACTKQIEIPAENETVQDSQPGKKMDIQPLVKLSGMKCLLHDHYLNHRQSFSD